MKNQDKPNNRLVELLWIEINRAIINSDNVKVVLENLRALDLLKDVKEYNLVLDINKLIELTAGENSNIDFPNNMAHIVENRTENFEIEGHADLSEPTDDAESRPAPITRKEGLQNSQYIDGKPLSKNQILFQEYLEQHFDNPAWLKKARIFF